MFFTIYFIFLLWADYRVEFSKALKPLLTWIVSLLRALVQLAKRKRKKEIGRTEHLLFSLQNIPAQMCVCHAPFWCLATRFRSISVNSASSIGRSDHFQDFTTIEVGTWVAGCLYHRGALCFDASPLLPRWNNSFWYYFTFLLAEHFPHKYDWTGVTLPLTEFPAVLLQHRLGKNLLFGPIRQTRVLSSLRRRSFLQDMVVLLPEDGQEGLAG